MCDTKTRSQRLRTQNNMTTKTKFENGISFVKSIAFWKSVICIPWQCSHQIETWGQLDSFSKYDRGNLNLHIIFSQSCKTSTIIAIYFVPPRVWNFCHQDGATKISSQTKAQWALLVLKIFWSQLNFNTFFLFSLLGVENANNYLGSKKMSCTFACLLIIVVADPLGGQK